MLVILRIYLLRPFRESLQRLLGHRANEQIYLRARAASSSDKSSEIILSAVRFRSLTWTYLAIIRSEKSPRSLGTFARYLLLLLFQVYHAHQHDVYLIADGAVVIKVRHHVHDGQQVLLVIGVVVVIEEPPIGDQSDLYVTVYAVRARRDDLGGGASHRVSIIVQQPHLPLSQLFRPGRLPVVC